FDFPTHTRMQDRFEVIRPGDFLIVEGLFTFYWPEVRRAFNLRAFVAAPDPVCFERRKARDIAERGYNLDFVLMQYNTNVRPGSEKFILPTRQFADVVVGGEQPVEESARAIFRLVTDRLAKSTGRGKNCHSSFWASPSAPGLASAQTDAPAPPGAPPPAPAAAADTSGVLAAITGWPPSSPFFFPCAVVSLPL